MSRDLRQNAFLTAVLMLVALFAPLYGIVFSALAAWQQERSGHRTMRNMALASLALAVLAFAAPGIVPQVGPGA